MALIVLASCSTVVLLTQYLTALLRSSSSPVVPAGVECDSVSEVPRGKSLQGTVMYTALQYI